MILTVLITAYQKNRHLRVTLPRICQQALDHVEVIVLDDEESPNKETQQICEQNPPVQYLHTGTRPELQWRIPGFALNIGAKRAQGDYLVITCAEIFHINNCIDVFMHHISRGEAATSLLIPEGKLDGRDELCLKNVEELGDVRAGVYDKQADLDDMLPFFMCMPTQIFLGIGGYDEDFTGQAFDDNDIVDRLRASGLEYLHTHAKIVHLYHTTIYAGRQTGFPERWKYNKAVYEQRKGILRRNTGKEWGVNHE